MHKAVARFRISKMTGFFIVIVLAMVGMVLFAAISRDTEYSTRSDLIHDAVVYVPGRVTEIVSESTALGAHGIRIGSQYLRIKILKGDLKGEEMEILNHLHAENSVWAKKGQILNIYLSYNLEDPSIFFAYVSTPERSYINYMIILVFFVLIPLVGGKTGLRSVFALTFTFVSIIFLLIPLIVREWPPVLTTMGVSFVISTVTLVAILGFTKKTYISMISTVCGIVFCCAIYYIVSAVLLVNGYHAVNLDYMILVMSHTNMGIGDLLFCGILISSLGGLTDIAVSVSSSVNEIYASRPDISYDDLLRSSIIVGRDNAASMANTMVLAFAGTFFIALVTYRISGTNYDAIINSSDIAIEILRAVSATAALVIVAPITAMVASRVYSQNTVALEPPSPS